MGPWGFKKYTYYTKGSFAKAFDPELKEVMGSCASVLLADLERLLVQCMRDRLAIPQFKLT